MTWATRVGAVVLLIGVIYFFKYAVDRGWLGPWARVGIGLVVGGGTVGAAEWLRPRVSAAWAQVTSGVGLAIVLAAIYAAHGFYDLIPVAAAFVAFAVVVGAGAALAWRHDSQALLAFSLLGGLLDPLLMSTGVDRPLVFFAWLLVLSAGILLVAARRAWPIAGGVALLGVMALAAGWYVEHYDLYSGGAYHELPARLVPTFAAIAFAGLYAAVGLLARERVLAAAAWCASAAVALGATMALHADHATVVTLVLAALAPAFALGVRQIGRAELAVAALAIAAAAQLGAAAGGFAAPAGPPALVAVSLWALANLGVALWWGLGDAEGDRRAVVPLLVSATLAWVALLLACTDGDVRLLRGLATVAAMCVHAGLAALFHHRGRTVERGASLLLALVLAVLAVPFLFDGLAVTVAWLALMAGTGVAAGRLRSERLLSATAALMVLVLVRVGAVDFMLGEPRELTWHLRGTAIASAIGLFVTAWGVRGAPPARSALVVFRIAIIVGHLSLLAWLVGEAWLLLPDRALVSTILVAVYGAAALAGGFAARHALHRWLGLGLLTAAVGKLVLVDVWSLEEEALMMIMIPVGALLVSSGFLYARFSERIKRAILEDEPGE